MDADVEQAILVGQLVTELFGQAQTALTIYLTVTSGYLLVAYLVGKSLTTFQVVVVTGLFVYFGVISSLSVYGYYQSAAFWGQTYGLGRAEYWLWRVITPACILGILACLKFMWDIRHPKPE